MIDADLISDNPDFYIPKKLSLEELKKSIQSPFEFDYHWVVLETAIKEYPWLNKYGETEYKLDFKVYTWGGTRKWILSHDVFKDGYFGYIAGK